MTIRISENHIIAKKRIKCISRASIKIYCAHLCIAVGSQQTTRTRYSIDVVQSHNRHLTRARGSSNRNITYCSAVVARNNIGATTSKFSSASISIITSQSGSTIGVEANTICKCTRAIYNCTYIQISRATNFMLYGLSGGSSPADSPTIQIEGVSYPINFICVGSRCS